MADINTRNSILTVGDNTGLCLSGVTTAGTHICGRTKGLILKLPPTTVHLISVIKKI